MSEGESHHDGRAEFHRHSPTRDWGEVGSILTNQSFTACLQGATWLVFQSLLGAKLFRRFRPFRSSTAGKTGTKIGKKVEIDHHGFQSLALVLIGRTIW